MQILGIDIGGSGIKGAPVKLKKGRLARKRYRIPTPDPSTPDAVSDTVLEIVEHFSWKAPIGVTFPSPIKKGVVYTAANVDDAWIGVDGQKLLEQRTGCPVVLLNDADAAGLAEMTFGAGRGREGTVFVLTLGTGIGTAIFVDGKLVPNMELGHLIIPIQEGGFVEAEEHASDRIRKAEDLDWDPWAERINDYLQELDELFWPDVYIIGGGVSKRHQRFLPQLRSRVDIVPAQLRNEAGIVGAALAASRLLE